MPLPLHCLLLSQSCFLAVVCGADVGFVGFLVDATLVRFVVVVGGSFVVVGGSFVVVDGSFVVVDGSFVVVGFSVVVEGFDVDGTVKVIVGAGEVPLKKMNEKIVFVYFR